MNGYGLIGYPLGHSFSKQYFTAKFEKQGIKNTRYDEFPIKNIESFPQLIKQDPFLKGLNVTIPYKQSVIPYLDDISGLPKGLSACNCIKITEGKTAGYNTDITGFEKALFAHLKPHQNSALIFGNGGAAAAVKYVFEKNHIDFKTVSRTLHHDADYTYQDLDAAILAGHLILVNTTPLGMTPHVDSCPDIPYSAITTHHYLFDLVYNPAQTLFLRKGGANGATVQNGYDMLRIQAEESWKIWNTI